jgi:hypothetical protein
MERKLPQVCARSLPGDNMDGSEIYGRTIKVAAAKPQKDANEGLGSKTAIWQSLLCRYPILLTDSMFGQIPLLYGIPVSIDRK